LDIPDHPVNPGTIITGNRGDNHNIPDSLTHNRETIMADPGVEGSTGPDKKRDELVGKVLVTNDLIQYQDGTVASRMIVCKKTGTITLFAFDAGEGLSEHSAPFDAILTVTDGTAEVSISGKPYTVRTGEMIILPANIPHGVQAKKRFRMTLTMIRE
jgi:quercetin dioxygenase-like cupin family protein